MQNDPHAVRQQWKIKVEFDLITHSRENTFTEEDVQERISNLLRGMEYNHAGKFAVKIGEINSAEAKDVT
jgi:hypothetical protein